MPHLARTVLCASIAALTTVTACTDVETLSDEEPHSGPAMNYHVIDRNLATSGHFVGDGLNQLATGGLKVVIDLRDSPPPGQKQKLAQRGMEWISVPVDWDNPKLEDYELFKTAMSNHTADNLLVQCQANYRASAMTYLYRVLVAGVPEQNALADLHAVWKPNELWSEYIRDVKANQANRPD